jgi:hypothetical protein
MFPQNPFQPQEEMPSNLLQIAPCPSYYTTKPIWNSFIAEMMGKAKQLNIELFFAPNAWKVHQEQNSFHLIEEYNIDIHKHQCVLGVKLDNGKWVEYPISYYDAERIEMSDYEEPIIAELLQAEGVKIQVPAY